jgi:hypothetical protein
MNIRAIVVPALLLLSLASAAQAAEKFYKWKDESGAWHYTRTPPPAGAQAENVEVKSAQPATGSAMPAASSDQAGEPAGGTADAGAATTGDVSVDSRADRTAQCEKARQYAATLANNTYVARDTNGDGEPELMSDAEKQRETERAQMAVKLACE